jgi:hypothetical protein
MRQPARIIVNVLTAASFLLSIAVAWLWVRGYTWYDDIGVVVRATKPDGSGRERHCQIASGFGVFTCGVTIYEWTSPRGAVSQNKDGIRFWRNVIDTTDEGVGHGPQGFTGFSFRHDAHTPRPEVGGYSFRSDQLFVPSWFMLLIMSIVAAIRAVRLAVIARTRLVRRRRGQCATCGYNLRASPGRCPECGASPHNPPLERTGPAV